MGHLLKKSGQRGFGLVESMVTVGVVSVIALGMAEWLRNQDKQIKGQQIAMIRNDFFSRLQRLAGDAQSLNRSLSGAHSASFAGCANGTGCNTSADQGFTLMDSAGTVYADGSTPIRYDVNGSVCAGPASPTCPLEALVHFTPDCGGASPCTRARAVSVKVTLRQAAGVTAPSSGPPLRTLTGSVISAIPLVLTASGTVNYVTKWVNSNVSGDSQIYDNASNVGIGTNNPQAKLEVAGSLTASSIRSSSEVRAISFIYDSDARLKTDIERLGDGALDRVLQLHGASFVWRATGKKDFGLIAQEVEEVLPELVSTNKRSGIKSVDYGKIIPFLIESIKNQQEQIRELKEMVLSQRQSLNGLAPCDRVASLNPGSPLGIRFARVSESERQAPSR